MQSERTSERSYNEWLGSTGWSPLNRKDIAPGKSYELARGYVLLINAGRTLTDHEFFLEMENALLQPTLMNRLLIRDQQTEIERWRFSPEAIADRWSRLFPASEQDVSEPLIEPNSGSSSSSKIIYSCLKLLSK